MANKEQILKYIDSILLFLWGFLFLLFPFVMSTMTTESFILPKQILVATVVLLSLILLAIKMAISQQVRIRRTSLDVPIAIFALALLVSSLISVNRADALLAYVPVLLAILGYYIVVNVLRRQNAVIFALSAFVTGGVGIAILAIFSYLKVYPLPFDLTHAQSFTPLGSLLEQVVYLALILPVGLTMGWKVFKGDTSSKSVGFLAASLLVGAGILVTIAQLLTIQKPLLLPFETGFQTAFAAISQDTGRIAQGFFFGSGYGTYASVFTRFKQAAFNTDPSWYLSFTQSSSLVLELLATTGIVGILSFFLIIFRTLTKPSKKRLNPLYISLVILTVVSFILPFSFQGIALLFLILGLFSAAQAFKHPSQFYDIEPKFVALKKGLISFEEFTTEKVENSKLMPYAGAVIMLLFVTIVGIYATRFVISNIDFQQSLVAANSNNGSTTYKYQVAAINIFPYQNAYYRIFSQTNIALANSIATAQPKGSSPSAQAQNTVYTLIQQGITTGKQATALSPLTVANWQNLSSVYRALIGIGQGADTFAIQAAQQAVLLDPSNPQEYISLGGLYYQLGQYDNAIRAFQQAIQLKQDYANAYYNIGHAYLQKNDQQDAMQAFQAVEQLTVNDKANHDKIVGEINDLQKQMQSTGAPTPTPAPAAAATQTKTSPSSVQEPLNIGGPQEPLTASPTPTQ